MFHLRARIGSIEFDVGKHAQLTAPASGRLYLGIVDSYYRDNDGAFLVQVQHEAE